MKVTDQDYFFLPIQGYKADLNIIDSEGNDMIILSDSEAERLGFKMTELNRKYAERMKTKLSTETQKLSENFRIIVVLFNKREEEFYEKVKVLWKEKIKDEDIDKDGKISQIANIPIHIPRYGSSQGATSSLYLSIKVDPKFTLVSEPQFHYMDGKSIVQDISILNDPNHKVYRFAAPKESQLLQVSLRIGKPKDIKNWLTVGLMSAIIPPIAILVLALAYLKIPPFGFEVLGGIITFLIGEKALIFQDLSLLKKWNKVIIGSTIWVMVLLIALIILSALTTTQKS